MRNSRSKCMALLLVVAMLLACVGCGEEAEPKDLMAAIAATPVEGRAADDGFVTSQMNFAVGLLQQCVAKDSGENVLISPISVMLALAMTANGASGQTLQEMEDVLGGGMPIADLNEYLYHYRHLLMGSELKEIQFADSIWFRDTDVFTVKESFLQKNADYYEADAFCVPFNSATEKSINDWVSEKTKGRIDKILDKINEEGVMYLLNTLTFDAEWESFYTERSVREGEFVNQDGDKRTVEMMHSEEMFYLEDDAVIGVRKPYKGEMYSFVALLPKEGTVEEYVRNLSVGSLMALLNSEHRETVKTAIPKIESNYDVKMKELLCDMGMPTAFYRGDVIPDFSNMVICLEPPYIEEVRHKTYIMINENGTKAGAATLVEMLMGGMNTEFKEVILNRPFVYMIIHNETKLPIFIGVMSDATE